MAFTTKLDFSSNRQVKQRIETITILSGGTSFGVPFNLLPTGPDLTTTGETGYDTSIVSTFSGNNTTTIYNWFNPNMELAWSSLSALTPSNSATTQEVGPIFTANTLDVIDGNTIALDYSGVSYDIYVLAMTDLGSGNYSGTVETDFLYFYSAGTLDFTGRTIWADVSGITRTEDLIISKNPIIGNVWTCIDSEGKGGWSPTTGSTSGTSLYWYAENTTPPAVTPIASGTDSIALGDGAQALSSNMFVYGSNAGNGTTGATNSNFFGYYTGYQAINSIGSNFIGYFAGYQAKNSTYSNFIGSSAGFQASGSTNSNFIGSEAGTGAINATNANFIGQQAGNTAISSYGSNFFGTNSGYLASGSSDSNFIGTNAGKEAINAHSSNFIGNDAGYQAKGSNSSNFIGVNAGYQASGSYYSIFMGLSTGWEATGSTHSNFIGYVAGYQATNVVGSNFIGYNAGLQATNATNSNFIGYEAGYRATGVTYSNFIGVKAGYLASSASSSNFIGESAGYGATGVTFSNFIGVSTGVSAKGAVQSNFLGYFAGWGATGSSHSNFIGESAGYNAKDNVFSNFIGYNAGYGASNAGSTIFFGYESGYAASGASNSNFIGQYAGKQATNSSASNFIGIEAGYQAIGATNSNFIGRYSGNQATGATNSNFLGTAAGYLATNASYSNFIGQYAGSGATSVTYSNLFGYQAGKTFTSNNIGSNNIIIGTNISLPNATTDSINIGGVLFGINTNNTTGGDPSTGATASGKIGIGIVTPTEGLDVAGNARFRTIGSSASAGALHYDSNGVLTTSTSDERLKSNISQLTNSLDKIKQLRGVTYNWNENLTGQTRIGFVAQEVETVVPELTFINNNSPEKYMGVHYDNITALLVEAVKELATGTTSVVNTYLETQTILAEDNNIELNYSGTPTTAIGGGISVLHAKGEGLSAEIITDADGNWVTNNDFKPNALTIPTYTPTSSSDINGSEGNLTRDEDYLYIKTSTGWKRTNLENF